MAKFTIITPVFNGAKYIEETVRSVLASTNDIDFEYLVIDDGSTDGTREILHEFDLNLKYFYQENSGQAIAINNGLNRASGTYSIIVNADDPLITNRIFLDAERIMDVESEVVATYPDWNIIDSEGKVIEIVKVKDFDFVELVGKFNCLIGPGGVFRTEIAKRINGWDASYKFVPDYDFWIRLSEFGNFKHVHEIQASWRTHDSSISIASRSQEMADERIRVIDSFLERNPGVPKKLRKMAIGHSRYRAAVLCFFDVNIDGRKLILASIKSHPKILVEKDFRASAYLLLLPLSRFTLNYLFRFKYFQNAADSLRRRIKS